MSAGSILAIEASIYTGSVAVICEKRVAAACEVAMRGRDEERLMPAVASALAQAKTPMSGIAAVVCGGGPGSFTSLRIAASIAKGIASGRDIPLFSVSSLLLMVAGSAWSGVTGRYLPALDAMRGDHYAACYEVMEDCTIQLVSPAALVRSESLTGLAEALKARIMGPGQALHSIPSAGGVAMLSTTTNMSEVDVGAWEPDYGRPAEAQARWEAAHGVRTSGPQG